MALFMARIGVQMEEFMGLAGTTLAEMRLVIEGAIQLYAGLPPLYQQAMAEGRRQTQ